jgi:hypothetical protein
VLTIVVWFAAFYATVAGAEKCHPVLRRVSLLQQRTRPRRLGAGRPSREHVSGHELRDACPETSFILDHHGNANGRAKNLSGWKTDIGRIAWRMNPVRKMSGIVASAEPKPWSQATWLNGATILSMKR